jgi:hypothetical protein
MRRTRWSARVTVVTTSVNTSERTSALLGGVMSLSAVDTTRFQSGGAGLGRCSVMFARQPTSSAKRLVDFLATIGRTDSVRTELA